MYETSNAGTVSMGEQTSCAFHIDTKEFVAMSAAFEAFSKVGSRVKQYVDATQMLSKARDIAHVPRHNLHRKSRKLRFGFSSGSSQGFHMRSAAQELANQVIAQQASGARYKGYGRECTHDYSSCTSAARRH